MIVLTGSAGAEPDAKSVTPEITVALPTVFGARGVAQLAKGTADRPSRGQVRSCVATIREKY